MDRVPCPSILSPGPDFIYLSPDSDFITRPVPDFIRFESCSGSGFYFGSPEGDSGSVFYQFLSPGLVQMLFIEFGSQLLSIFESRSKF